MELEQLSHGVDREMVDAWANPAAPSSTQSQDAGGPVTEPEIWAAAPLLGSSRGSHADVSIHSPSASHQHVSPSMPNPVVFGDAAAGASEEPTYLQRVSLLRPYFPHLRNVLRRSREKCFGHVNCYDYAQGSLKTSRTFREDGTAAFLLDDAGQHLRHTLSSGQDANVETRFLLVTDLSSELIEILGSCLSIDPGFFEEHLLNAGWNGFTG